MSKSLVKSLHPKPPKELRLLLETCHLVGDETAEDYKNLFDAVASSARPADIIGWLYVKSFVDLIWDIRRERAIKVTIVVSKQKEIVLELLRTTQDDPTSVKAHLYNIFGADNEVRQWMVNPKIRKEIDERLAARGFSVSDIVARAYIEAASEIDQVERRIANYEARMMLLMRDIERRNEPLARSLEKASADVIDAEFSEAAE